MLVYDSTLDFLPRPFRPALALGGGALRPRTEGDGPEPRTGFHSHSQAEARAQCAAPWRPLTRGPGASDASLSDQARRPQISDYLAAGQTHAQATTPAACGSARYRSRSAGLTLSTGQSAKSSQSTPQRDKKSTQRAAARRSRKRQAVKVPDTIVNLIDSGFRFSGKLGAITLRVRNGKQQFYTQCKHK